MKKIFAIVLALCIVMALAACGVAEASVSEKGAQQMSANYDEGAVIVTPMYAEKHADQDVNELFVCTHKAHDATTAVCLTCGEKMSHTYVDGVCTGCGRSLDIRTSGLPAEWFEQHEEQGKMESVYYKADLVGTEGKTRGTYLCVYTPPSYDENQRYNVLMFIDGDFGPNPGWLTAKEWVRGIGNVQGKNMFDYIMANELVEPCIIATVFQDYYTAGSSPEQLAHEIKDYALPYIAENYSTYMEDGSHESQCAAREHLCIGGLSNYSQYMWRAGLMMCTDICANFISLSGTHAVPETVAHLHEEELAGNSLNFFYMTVGTLEGRYNSDAGSYKAMIEGCDYLVDNENAFFVPITGEHEWAIWFAGAYNALQLICW